MTWTSGNNLKLALKIKGFDVVAARQTKSGQQIDWELMVTADGQEDLAVRAAKAAVTHLLLKNENYKGTVRATVLGESLQIADAVV
jgi:hypothetical protein